MIKITIEIPKEFEEHYNIDHFVESLTRIESDIRFHGFLSGLYEVELIEMLGKAFDNAKVVNDKTNEWHYTSKGEYPKEYENVLCYCKGPCIKFCCVGHIIIGGDNKVRWWANNKSEELRVIAWCEISKYSEE